MAAPALAPKLLTLVVPTRAGEVLLGRKLRGFGAGFWNGFGGKVEPGEGVAAAAARELAEECGLAAPPAALARRGQLTFLWEDQPAEPPWEVSVFAVEASACGGGVRASDEMAPRWFPADLAALPFAEMWADDAHWWPLLLKEGAPLFEGRFRFADGTRLVEVEALREVAALPPLAR